ncbi:hypothetical protein ABIC83_002504 [Roseateles asaccharophilus]|uniref:hypothetical protein n=1 Tax=Roseateles asaccharophilus TaxID=582607 RepID=UPI0038393451
MPSFIAYHATTAPTDFAKFEYTDDIGFHFGSIATANRRLEQILDAGDPDDLNGARVLVCRLRLAKPLRLPDCHTWTPNNVTRALHRAGVIDDQRRDDMLAEGYLDQEVFRAVVEAAGYDSVVYANETEGGGDSYIALRPEQIDFAIAKQLLHAPRAAGGPQTHPRIIEILSALNKLELPGPITVFGSAAQEDAYPGDVDIIVDLRATTRRAYLANDPGGARLEPLLRIAANRPGWFDPFVRFAGDDLLARSPDSRRWVKAQNAQEILAGADTCGRKLSDVLSARRPAQPTTHGAVDLPAPRRMKMR